jgi:hypothetical protein
MAGLFSKEDYERAVKQGKNPVWRRTAPFKTTGVEGLITTPKNEVIAKLRAVRADTVANLKRRGY